MIEQDGGSKVDEKEGFHMKLLERMRLHKNLAIVNSGFISSDNTVAVSEELFPFIARGYIHSEYCAIGTFKTIVHDIQSSHEENQTAFAERFFFLSNDLRQEHINMQAKTNEDFKRIQDMTDISKQTGKCKMNTAQAVFWKDKAESI